MRKVLAAAGAISLVLGLVVNVAVLRPARSTAPAARTSPSMAAQARASFQQAFHERVPSMEMANVGTSNGPVTQLLSYNWSGFADATTYQPVSDCTSAADGCQSVSLVTGSWTVPAVTCPSPPFQNEDQFVADWVGVDGFNDTTVEQTGTASYCFEGTPYYYAWYELYPNATVVEGPLSCADDNIGCPRPGDRITAAIQVQQATPTEDNFRLSLIDFSTPADSFTTTEQCPTSTCFDNSAEWVTERPAFDTTGVVPLADFSSTGFSGAGLVANGHPSTIQGYRGGVFDLDMIDSTASYFLDCVGQTSGPGLLLVPTSSTSPDPCPPVQPGGGSYWSASGSPVGNGQAGLSPAGGAGPGGKGLSPGSSFGLAWDDSY